MFIYIYIKGQSINPAEIFQQATRIRNINKLYYFSSCKPKEEKYKSLKECKQLFKRQETATNAILECSTILDNETEETLIIQENKFFNIYCLNEYFNDTYETNKRKHFEIILENAGFVLSTKGEENKLSKDDNKKLLIPIQERKDEIFNNYIDDFETHLDIYDDIKKKVEILKIPNDEKDELIKYKNIITDDFKFKEYLKFLKTMKTNEYIKEKINEDDFKNMKVITNNSEYKKIFVFRNILKDVLKNDNIYNIEYPATEDIKIKLDDDKTFLIKHLVRTKKNSPKNMKEFKQLHITILKQITFNDIIESKQIKEKQVQKRQYKLNEK